MPKKVKKAPKLSTKSIDKKIDDILAENKARQIEINQEIQEIVQDIDEKTLKYIKVTE